MSFPRYEAYKDSGVEWLGVIPAHWVVTRVKRVSSIFDRLDPSDWRRKFVWW